MIVTMCMYIVHHFLLLKKRGDGLEQDDVFRTCALFIILLFTILIIFLYPFFLFRLRRNSCDFIHPKKFIHLMIYILL
jgi:hypothetical protein